MGLLTLMIMFFLALFGLVSSGMLMKKFNDANDSTSTGYKYSIFSLVFFIVAVLGVIITGTMSSTAMKTYYAPGVSAPVETVGAPAVAGAKNIGVIQAKLV